MYGKHLSINQFFMGNKESINEKCFVELKLIRVNMIFKCSSYWPTNTFARSENSKNHFFFQLENQNSNQNFGWEILNIPIPVVIFYQISVYHFLSGAPWWVTWCLRRYHLFFTFFWQISHWSSFPTVCMFNMCWNKRLLNSLDWLKR